jgi:tRNA modification GTPase
MSETIFALASGGIVKSAVAVIRISGSRVRFVLEMMGGSVPPARVMTLTKLKSIEGEVLDHALVVYFPAPYSFTGEDCAEFQIHGGKAIIARVLFALTLFEGVRFARAGEFTQRAFGNNKLNLAQVEGLADLIDAETEAQRRQGLRQLEGVLGKKALIWRKNLVSSLMYLEAHLDFSDEGDVPLHVHDEINRAINEVCADLNTHMKAAVVGEKIRDGFIVTLLGPPNAGKSSLMNALVRRDVALVSPYAGTTRDSIEVSCDLEGLLVTFIDTAGLRETTDPIEALGIERSRLKAAQSDLQIWLSPFDSPATPPENISMENVLILQSKSDLSLSPLSSYGKLQDAMAHPFSVHMPETIDSLAKLIHGRLDSTSFAESGILTRERHRIACQKALISLERVNTSLQCEQEELASEDIRLAIRNLDSLIGSVGVEDILDQLFSSFCIGK